MDILKTTCNLFKQVPECAVDMSVILQQLTQRLILTEPLNIYIKFDSMMFLGIFIVSVELNENRICNGIPSFKSAYLCSVLLILLGCDVSFTDAIIPRLSVDATEHLSHAQLIDDLWHMYKTKNDLKRLQTLCVQKVRQTMHSLTDDSFRSLPVPSYIRKLLKLHDVTDVVYQAYQMWPKCMAIELFM